MTDRMAPLYVTLDDAEIRLATETGRARRITCEARNAKDETGFNEHHPDHELANIQGVWGEIAFCKVMGFSYQQLDGTMCLPDARWYIQIRCAPCRAPKPPIGFGRLIHRVIDDPRDRFTLVVGNPPYFVLLGWIDGHLMRQEKWLRYEAGRPPAWFVPNEVLNKNMDELLRR